MPPAEVVYTKSININAIRSIVDKSNILVKTYASKLKISQHMFGTTYHIHKMVSDDTVVNVEIRVYQINMESVFKDTEKYRVYNNSPFLSTRQWHDVVKDLVQEYYPEYALIVDFINRLIHETPAPLTKDNFNIINSLYEKIVKDRLLTAQEQIEIENNT